MRKCLLALLLIACVAYPCAACPAGFAGSYRQFVPYQSQVHVLGVPAYYMVPIPVQSAGVQYGYGYGASYGYSAPMAAPCPAQQFQSLPAPVQAPEQIAPPQVGYSGYGAGVTSYTSGYAGSYGYGGIRARFYNGIGSNTYFRSTGIYGQGVGLVRSRVFVGGGINGLVNHPVLRGIGRALVRPFLPFHRVGLGLARGLGGVRVAVGGVRVRVR